MEEEDEEDGEGREGRGGSGCFLGRPRRLLRGEEEADRRKELAVRTGKGGCCLGMFEHVLIL